MQSSKSTIITNDTLKDYISSLRSGLSSKVEKKKNPEIIKRILFSIMGRKLKWKPPSDKILIENIKNVLIVRYDAIGDYIVTTPIIRFLKENNPDIKVDMLTSPRNNSIAANDPFIDHTFIIQQENIFNRSNLKSVLRARKNNYDLIICAIFTKFTKSALLASLIAPKAEKIALMHYGRRKIYGLVFNRQLQFELKKDHWMDVLLRLTTENINNVEKRTYRPYLYIKKESFDIVRKIIVKHNLSMRIRPGNIFLDDGLSLEKLNYEGKQYCVINVSAFDKGRSWNKNNFVAVINDLLKRHPEQIFFVSGDPGSSETVHGICSIVNDNRCIPLLVNLEDFVAILAGAKFLISPDTAPVHIAAAAGVPVLALFQDQFKPIVWYPKNVSFALVVSGTNGDINSIKPEEVLKAEQLIGN